MNYKIKKLDNRYSYSSLFEYMLTFTGSMSSFRGPVHFNHAIQWCTTTWGWSAETQQYADMRRWAQLTGTQFDVCNPKWSWSNRTPGELRIYLQDQPELAFFQLANPVDQK